MEETVSHSTQYLYDTVKIGITIPVRGLLQTILLQFSRRN